MLDFAFGPAVESRVLGMDLDVLLRIDAGVSVWAIAGMARVIETPRG